MDLGNAVYTEYKMDESVAAYIAQNIELFDCDCQLLHSHHNMASSFSGTDISTLQEEGAERNCFVSLIVNNIGSYSAAITRKIQKKFEVTTKSLGSSYEFFGDGTITMDNQPEALGTSKVIEQDVIEYFWLNVEREITDNPYEYLDERFEEIEAVKAEKEKAASNNPPKYLPPTTTQYAGNDYDEDDEFFTWLHRNKTEKAAEEATLFDKQTMDEMVVEPEWSPDPTIIHHIVIQLLTCSLIVYDKIDIKWWIEQKMPNTYSGLFGNSDSLEFENWIDFYVEFLITSYDCSGVPADIADDWDSFTNLVAEAILDELDSLPNNFFMRGIKDRVRKYTV